MIHAIHIALIAALATLAGCTESIFAHPLPPDTKNDQRVLGTWLYEMDDVRLAFRFLENDNAEWDLEILTSSRHNNEFMWIPFTFHTTQIGSSRYINLRQIEKNKYGRGVISYFVIRYEIAAPKIMKVSLPEHTVLEDAIAANHLMGTKHKSDLLVTSSAEELWKYLSTAPEGLFKETYVAVRIEPDFLDRLIKTGLEKKKSDADSHR